LRTYVSKMILGREIPKEQAQKLLSTGKTDLLEGFISKRGRPFSAYLKLEDEKSRFRISGESDSSQRIQVDKLARHCRTNCAGIGK